MRAFIPLGALHQLLCVSWRMRLQIVSLVEPAGVNENEMVAGNYAAR